MTTQLPPDELNAENESICEKLLGWIRHTYPANESPAWEVPSKAGEFQPTVFVTPSFTTWANAGLILEALSARGTNPSLDYREGKWDCYGGDPFESFFHAYADTGPLAIRAAALEYIKVMS